MNIQRNPRLTVAADQLTVDPSIDLERVMWDLEYRRDAIARLAREARARCGPERKE